MVKRTSFLYPVRGAILFALLTGMAGCSSEDSVPLADRYLGQVPPGNTPTAFAPSIIPGEFRVHGFMTFSSDGGTVLWPVIPPRILTMTYAEGAWTPPNTASFSQGNAQAPCFSPDGERLFFQMSGPDGGSLDLWSVVRTDTGWSAPVNLGKPVNSARLEAQPSVTRDGTLYFTGSLEDVMWNRGIYRSRCIDGTLQPPELLPAPINTEYLEIYPFIDPDERYLLFCSSRPSLEEADRRMFISFRGEDDSWSEPLCLEERLGLTAGGAFPYVSPDGKYFFFTGGGMGPGIYWVNAGFLDRLLEEYRSSTRSRMPDK